MLEAHVVHLSDVGVRHLPGQPRLAQEHRDDALIIREVRQQQLHRHRPAELTDAGLELDQSVGEKTLTLGSGSYFFDGIVAVGQHTLTVDGAVALYVNGDFETVGATHLALTPGSTLDLYVDGDVQMVGDSSFGAGATPGAVRLYVAGERKVSLVGAQKVVGSVYAPNADLELVGETTFEGSLFARNVDGVGKLNVSFAAPVVATPESELCQPTEVVPN